MRLITVERIIIFLTIFGAAHLIGMTSPSMWPVAVGVLFAFTDTMSRRTAERIERLETIILLREVVPTESEAQ